MWVRESPEFHKQSLADDSPGIQKARMLRQVWRPEPVLMTFQMGTRTLLRTILEAICVVF